MASSVLVFDSGVGGLSVLQEIHQYCPPMPIYYLMDREGFPYGIKEDEPLAQRILTLCQEAVAVLKPSLLVIACNTASTLALPLLRQHLTIPIVGVVPAIKVAAELSPNRCIGLLATPATVNRPYINDLINEFANDCTVTRFGSSALVHYAEHWLAQQQPPDALFEHLNGWLSDTPQPSHVVLGCTHFPLLRDFLERLWPHVTWIDSGAAIARRVASLLAPDAHQNGHFELYWTGTSEIESGVLMFLQGIGNVTRAQPLTTQISYTK
ncbi:MAG: glutamate racemase [Bacterioplanes sp.]|nr:glutamate racemase [Bacterioplanes sp.]